MLIYAREESIAGHRVYIRPREERLSDHTQCAYTKKIAAERKFMNPSCRNSGTLSCSSRRRGWPCYRRSL